MANAYYRAYVEGRIRTDRNEEFEKKKPPKEKCLFRVVEEDLKELEVNGRRAYINIELSVSVGDRVVLSRKRVIWANLLFLSVALFFFFFMAYFTGCWWEHFCLFIILLFLPTTKKKKLFFFFPSSFLFLFMFVWKPLCFCFFFFFRSSCLLLIPFVISHCHWTMAAKETMRSSSSSLSYFLVSFKYFCEGKTK